MGVIEFQLERVVHAPAAEVFARLADIEGHTAWMQGTGSMLRRSEQTSPGDVGLGTTYLDRTRFGPTPGEVVEFDPPSALGYHWWDRTRGGRLNMEGWPSYALVPQGEDRTLVRHHARLVTYGAYRLATPVLGLLARRERTATMEALTASFGAAASTA